MVQLKQRVEKFFRSLPNDLRTAMLLGIIAVAFLFLSVLFFFNRQNDAVVKSTPQVAGAQTLAASKGQIGTAASTATSNGQATTPATTQEHPATATPGEGPAVIPAERLSRGSGSQPNDPTPVPFGLVGPAPFTLRAGEVSMQYDVHTADESSVTWQLATGAAYWDTITPEKTGAPAFLVIDQPLSQNVSSTLFFHIQVQPELLPGEYGYYEYPVHISDPSRNIDRVYSISFYLAP